MSKPVKISLIIFSVFVLIVLIVAYVTPTRTIIQRKIIVNAKKQTIVDLIVSFKKMQRWSPWIEYDPTMKSHFYGVEGRVGSKFVWEGNQSVGQGEQEITAINDSVIQMRMQIIKPNRSEHTIYFKLNPDTLNESIEVTWLFESFNPFPRNLFTYFLDIDAMIGHDFEKGLRKLKAISEEIEKDQLTPIAKLEELNFPFSKIGALKNTNSKLSIEKKLLELNIRYPKLSSKIILHQPDEKNASISNSFAGTLDPISDSDTNLFWIQTQNLQAIKLAHVGTYEYISSAHIAILNYMNEKGYESSGIVVEEIVADSTTTSNSDHWITNVYYFKKD